MNQKTPPLGWRMFLGIGSLLLVAIFSGCLPLKEPQTIEITAASATAILHATSTEATSPQHHPTLLTKEERQSLESIIKIDEFPLYVMTNSAPYRNNISGRQEYLLPARSLEPGSTWSCSLFTALGKLGDSLYGRNFDWEHSPAVLLFNHSPGAFASVSMVNLAFLGIPDETITKLDMLPLTDRLALLDAPFLPIDGINQFGLVVGMAAVPNPEEIRDPTLPTVDSLLIIRILLDQAQNVEEALTLLQSYNIAWGYGPPLHYLLADPTGESALIEFYQGEIHIIKTPNTWHLATNFLIGPTSDDGLGHCWRYDTIYHKLFETSGNLTPQMAIHLLEEVSQSNTQWSVVYEMDTTSLNVVMGRQFEILHTFRLSRSH